MSYIVKDCTDSFRFHRDKCLEVGLSRLRVCTDHPQVSESQTWPESFDLLRDASSITLIGLRSGSLTQAWGL